MNKELNQPFRQGGLQVLNEEKETLKILHQLGLSYTQARVYLALAEIVEAPVKTISKRSGIDRAEIYRKMPTLLKMGLIEKELSVPIKFKAVPIKEGLDLLQKRENIKHQELQKRIIRVAKKLNENNNKVKKENENQFAIIPGKKAHIEWIKKKHDKLQRNTHGILTWKDDKAIHMFCEKEIERARSRNVESKIIIYVPENEKKEFENYQKSNNIQNSSQKRIISEQPLVFGGIFDNNEVVIGTTPNNPIQTGETVFWSNNSAVVSLFRNHFDQLWKTLDN
jgi:sugar-specific transcriptional regulator TrmB